MTSTIFLDLPDALSLPACKPTFYLGEDAWRFPCGLGVSAALPTAPGYLWAAFQGVHERHHAYCPPVDSWALLETVETGAHWVKITCTCSCSDDRRRQGAPDVVQYGERGRKEKAGGAL